MWFRPAVRGHVIGVARVYRAALPLLILFATQAAIAQTSNQTDARSAAEVKSELQQRVLEAVADPARPRLLLQHAAADLR